MNVDSEPVKEMTNADRQTVDYLRIRKAKGQKSRRLSFDAANLDMLPMMALFTVILCSLLKDYQNDPVRITPTPDTQLPRSSTKLGPEKAVQVAISPRAIMVGDKKVAIIKDGHVPKEFKEDQDPANPRIEPLFDALEREADFMKLVAQSNKSKSFTGMMTIIADKTVPFRLLTEVLYTAGKAQYDKYKFAVIKKGG